MTRDPKMVQRVARALEREFDRVVRDCNGEPDFDAAACAAISAIVDEMKADITAWFAANDPLNRRTMDSAYQPDTHDLSTSDSAGIVTENSCRLIPQNSGLGHARDNPCRHPQSYHVASDYGAPEMRDNCTQSDSIMRHERIKGSPDKLEAENGKETR